SRAALDVIGKAPRTRDAALDRPQRHRSPAHADNVQWSAAWRRERRRSGGRLIGMAPPGPAVQRDTMPSDGRAGRAASIRINSNTVGGCGRISSATVGDRMSRLLSATALIIVALMANIWAAAAQQPGRVYKMAFLWIGRPGEHPQFED